MYSISTQMRNNLAITLALLFVYYTYFGGDTASFLPLVALCGGDGGGDGGGGGDCSGGGGGCGDGGGTISSSTPFLCTWDGEKYCFENDFLFGKPSSLFVNLNTGKAAYEKGEVTGDLYKIQNQLRLKNGRPSFQIKEIEPEESYIDHISLSRFVHHKDTELLVNSNLNSVLAFKKHSLESHEGVVDQRFLWNGEDVSATIGDPATLFGNSNGRGRFIEPVKDTIEVNGKVLDFNTEAYLVLKSYYRDWTLGEIFTQAKTRNSISWNEFWSSARTPSDFAKVSALVLITAFLGLSSSVGSFLRSGNPSNPSGSITINDAQKLAALFATQRVLADIPPSPVFSRSIVIEYWSGNSFNNLDIYSPRYYQPTSNVFRIPKVAIQKTGDVRLRITATKRHKIEYMGFVAPSETITPKTEILKVTKAFHQRENKDYKTVLNARQSGEYLHTIPADIIDVEFEGPTLEVKNDEQDTYILASNGIYTNLSEDSRMKAGDWVSKLDIDARKWLKTMSSLQTSQKS